MEFRDLLEVTKNQLFIVGHNFRWLCIFDRFNVFVDDTRQISSKLFFRFNQFTNDSSTHNSSVGWVGIKYNMFI